VVHRRFASQVGKPTLQTCDAGACDAHLRFQVRILIKMEINLLKSLCQQFGLALSSEKLQSLELFVDLFIKKNKVINLTRFKNRDEFIIKHILDSLFLTQFFNIKPGMKIADLGTGGGLPGIPLAILYPKSDFTLIDSVQKKISCVDEFAKQLKLNNVEAVAERLEVIGQDPDYREQFDLVLARALAPLPTLLELCIPLVKKGGQFVALKGPAYLEEINKAHHAIKELKLDLPRAERYDLPEDGGKRFLLIFDKKRSMPKQYPRRVGMPKKRSL